MRNPIVPPAISEPFSVSIDRADRTSLTEQIQSAIAAAIGSGVLKPEARLPSWQDLATQLGVARGTVRRAYSALADSHLVTSTPTDGTRVARHVSPVTPPALTEQPLPSGYQYYGGPTTFQMGVPARDLFPAKVFARLHAQYARAEAVAPDRYPDPRGEEALRHEIAAHLSIARGVACMPAQVFVTAGYLGGLGTVLRILGLHGSDAWVEEPCFPVAREALRLSGMRPVPVLVDEEGLIVDRGRALAPDARVALVTPGQQAPLGMTLSLPRRRALLEWAAERNAWIIEDDYLGELQLRGRAAPALASVDDVGRVIHVGSFSKTISPVLRVGFVLVPPSLVATFTDAFAYAGAVPGSAIQNVVAAFMREGHYLRHLRRLKRALSASGDAVRNELGQHGLETTLAGLAAVVRLPPGFNDVATAEEAARAGFRPAPLSPWYAEAPHSQSGLLLGIASARGPGIERNCALMARLIRQAIKD